MKKILSSKSSNNQWTTMESIQDYIGYFFRLFPIKALLASIISYCATYFGVEASIFYWYCFFCVLDLVVGMFYAISLNASCFYFSKLWFYRMSIQLFIIAMIGGLFHMIFAMTGTLIPIVNGLLIICSFVSFGSAVDKLVFLGAPVPVFLLPIVNAMRRKMSYHIGNILKDEKLSAELEEVFNKKKMDDTNVNQDLIHNNLKNSIVE